MKEDVSLNDIVIENDIKDNEIRDEVAKLLEDVDRQVKTNASKTKSKTGVFATIKSIQGHSDIERRDSHLFNKDAIRRSLLYIRRAGYYCWRKYEGNQLIIKVTKRRIEPDNHYELIQ